MKLPKFLKNIKFPNITPCQFFIIILGLLVFLFILKGFGCSRVENYDAKINELVDTQLLQNCDRCEEQYKKCAEDCNYDNKCMNNNCYNEIHCIKMCNST